MNIDWDSPEMIERGKKIIEEMIEKEKKAKAFFESPEFFIILDRIKKELDLLESTSWITEQDVVYNRYKTISYPEFSLFCNSITLNLPSVKTECENFIFQETFWRYKELELSLLIGQGAMFSIKKIQ